MGDGLIWVGNSENCHFVNGSDQSFNAKGLKALVAGAPNWCFAMEFQQLRNSPNNGIQHGAAVYTCESAMKSVSFTFG
jgi:hypothetical protein